MKQIKFVSFSFLLLLMIGVIACRPSKEKPNQATGPATVITGTDGKNQLTLPSGWKQAYQLNKRAELQALNSESDCYLISISDNKTDFPNLTLEQHASTTLKKLLAGLKDPILTKPKNLTINGHKAIQYQIHGSFNSTPVVYIHTTIETQVQYNQIVTWTQESKFEANRPAMEQIINSFREKA